MVKKILIISVILLIFIAIGRVQHVYAQILPLPKPITGTFVFPDFNIADEKTLNDYLNEITDTGINTLIWDYTGVVYKTPDCNSGYTLENFYTENSSNLQINPEKFLQAIHDKGFSVYIGLAGTWNCVTAASDPDKIIELSKTLVQSLKNLCQSKHWDCQSNNSFIKGYYIPVEYTLKQFGAAADFYSRMYEAIKPLDPQKKILISPYTNNTYDPEDYQIAYQAGKIAVQNSYADIIALQDSVGSGKVTSFASDREHFQGLYDGIKSANQQFNKSVELWANIETFHNSLNSAVWPPTDINTLKQQMTTVDDLVSNKITWIYSWSMATLPLLNNYGGAQYTPEFAQKRKILRDAYVAWLGPFSTSALLGDLNSDGKVDIFDFNILVQNFGKTGSPGFIAADINKDGKVDIFDYNMLVANFVK